MTHLPFPTFALEPDTGICRLCGGENCFDDFGPERFLNTGQTLRLCRQCSLVYLAPDFTEAALNDFYRDHYRNLYIHEDHIGPESAVVRLSWEVGRKRAEILAKDLPQGARVLEIGSGYGAFLQRLHDIRPDVVLFATEPDQDNRKLLVKTASPTFVVESDLQGPFDLIATFHVLEHVKDPVAEVNRLTSHLAPTGRLVVEVPDTTTEWGMWGYVHPAHCCYFTAESFRRMVAAAGVTTRYVGVHPGGAPYDDSLWAVIEPTPSHDPIAPASEPELARLRAHIAKYRWTFKDAVRRHAKNFALRYLGKRFAGQFQRARTERRRVQFAQS